MTKYLISGYIGFDNFGDEAIASVLVSNLKKNGAEKITVLSSNPEKTARLYDVDSEYFLKFLHLNHHHLYIVTIEEHSFLDFRHHILQYLHPDRLQ